jgi:hypothetical protein
MYCKCTDNASYENSPNANKVHPSPAKGIQGGSGKDRAFPVGLGPVHPAQSGFRCPTPLKSFVVAYSARQIIRLMGVAGGMTASA